MATKPATTERLDLVRADLQNVEAQINDTETARAAALLGDDDARAVELAARLDKLQQQARTFRDKIGVLEAEVAREAEAEKERARAKAIAKVEGMLAQRDEAVKELAASVRVLDDCFKKAAALSKECGTAWPWLPHDREAGMLLPGSVLLALRHEIFRFSKPRLLGGMDPPDRGLDLPGGQSPRLELINNPNAVKPMVEVFAAATKCATEILKTGKSTSGEIVQTNIAENGVPVFARKDKPPLTASQQELSQLLARMALLAQQTSPEAEQEYFRTVKRVGELQALVDAEQGVQS